MLDEATGDLVENLGGIQEIRESDRVFGLLREIEAGYTDYHLITGSLGVQGVVRREIRPVHDIDMCVPREDGVKIDVFFKGLGFLPLPQEAIRRLGGNGMRYSRPDGMEVDVWYGDFTKQGLTLPNPKGRLFIPKEGLDYAVEIRGIQFETFSPEVNYFFKERATRRNPMQSLSFFNRSKDVLDYQELKKVVNSEKAKQLLILGFKYTGGHPMLRKETFQDIRDWMKLGGRKRD